MRRRAIALWRTTAVRFALLSTLLFCLVMGLGLGSVYVATIGAVERRTDETIQSEILALSERFREAGLRGLVSAVELRSGADALPGNVYLIASLSGRPLAGNLSDWPRGVGTEGWLAFPVTKQDGAEVAQRQVRARGFALPGGYRLLVGRDSEDQQRLRARFLGALIWVGLATGIFGLVAGLVLGRRVLARVAETAAAGERIAAGNLDSRVPVRGRGDEFDRLAEAVNGMLDRIEGLMAGMRIATDSISHDVRRPLTRLRAKLDLALQATADPARAEEAMRRAIAEIDTTVGILENLLRIARAEAGVPQDAWVDLDLAGLAGSAADLYVPLAEERGIALDLDLRPAPLRGEAQLLAQAIANLIDNALKHAPAGHGRIHLATGPADAAGSAGVRLVIRDNGPGIPQQDLDRVTERFVRLDQARATEGSGLGLSLVRAVTRMHGGALALSDAAPGLQVEMVFEGRRARA